MRACRCVCVFLSLSLSLSVFSRESLLHVGIAAYALGEEEEEEEEEEGATPKQYVLIALEESRPPRNFMSFVAFSL